MAQSKGELTVDKQILYLVQWFSEFSEFQRQDFLEYLLPVYGTFFKENLFHQQNESSMIDNSDEESTKQNGQIASKANGQMDVESLSNGLQNLNTRPPSIFECRMKLFKEWYNQHWSSANRVEFLLRLKNLDSGYVFDLYRQLLRAQNLPLDRTKVQETFEINSDTKTLAERLDLFNEEIYRKPMADLIQNGSLELFSNCNHSNDGQKPDLLANCHNCQQPDQSTTTTTQEPEIPEDQQDLTSKQPPDLLA